MRCRCHGGSADRVSSSEFRIGEQYPLTGETHLVHDRQMVAVVEAEDMADFMEQDSEQVDASGSFAIYCCRQVRGIDLIEFSAVHRGGIHKPAITRRIRINKDGITTSFTQDATGQVGNLYGDEIQTVELISGQR